MTPFDERRLIETRWVAQDHAGDDARNGRTLIGAAILNGGPGGVVPARLCIKDSLDVCVRFETKTVGRVVYELRPRNTLCSLDTPFKRCGALGVGCGASVAGAIGAPR